MTTWWLAEEFGRGGIARYAVDVALEIAPAVERVVVATTPSGPAPGWRGPCEVWFPVRSGPLGRLVGAAGGIARTWRRPSRGDVVWLPIGIRPAFEAVLAAAAQAAGARVVVTVHNRAPHDRTGTSPLVLRTARAADAVVVHTSSLTQWATREGLRVHHLPFPPPRVDLAAAETRHSRESLGVPAGSLCLLMFGNLAAYKGWRWLLEAFARAVAENPDLPVFIVLAGQAVGEEPLSVAQELGVAGRVRRLAGYLSDGELDALLGVADAVALPYAAIDHSGAGALAAARGLPALASDLPTLRELFGDRAVYVPPGDVAAMTRTISSLSTTLAQLHAEDVATGSERIQHAFQRFAAGFA